MQISAFPFVNFTLTAREEKLKILKSFLSTCLSSDATCTVYDQARVQLRQSQAASLTDSLLDPSTRACQWLNEREGGRSVQGCCNGQFVIKKMRMG